MARVAPIYTHVLKDFEDQMPDFAMKFRVGKPPPIFRWIYSPALVLDMMMAKDDSTRLGSLKINAARQDFTAVYETRPIPGNAADAF